MFENKKQITYCYIYNYFHICVFYATFFLQKNYKAIKYKPLR